MTHIMMQIVIITILVTLILSGIAMHQTQSRVSKLEEQMRILTTQEKK